MPSSLRDAQHVRFGSCVTNSLPKAPTAGRRACSKLQARATLGLSDPRATALARCFERLVRHPDALARLQRELDNDGDSDSDSDSDSGELYLDAVINETLRSRPIIDSVQRKLSAELELGGYRTPAGATVAPSIVAVQNFPDVFEDPRAFRPERFLEHPVAPYTLIPFGGGSRRCIGASFAAMEMKTVLRTVLANVDLQTSTSKPERPTRGRRISTYPARGARITVTDR